MEISLHLFVIPSLIVNDSKFIHPLILILLKPVNDNDFNDESPLISNVDSSPSIADIVIVSIAVFDKLKLPEISLISSFFNDVRFSEVPDIEQLSPLRSLQFLIVISFIGASTDEIFNVCKLSN